MAIDKNIFDLKDTNHSFQFYESLYNTKSAEEIVPYLNKNFKPASVIDVGCGNGTWLKVFSKFPNVKELTGIDNVDKSSLLIPEDWVYNVNLNKPFNLNKKCDLLLCLEVAEHLKEKSAEIFVESLCKHSDIIVFSAAIPRQGGVGHINEQWPDYWRKLFEKQNFGAYDILRKQFWDNENVKWWYRQNVFLFAERNAISHLNLQPESNLLAFIHPEFYNHLANPGVKVSYSQFRRAIKRKLRRYFS